MDKNDSDIENQQPPCTKEVQSNSQKQDDEIQNSELLLANEDEDVQMHAPTQENG